MSYDAFVKVVNLTKQFTLTKSLRKSNRRILTAVDSVNLSIYEGEKLGLVGESGCGKSTFGRTLLLLQKPTSGDVRYKGKSILRVSPKEKRQNRREMQIIFQDPYASLNPRRLIVDSIRAPLDVFKIGRPAERRDMVENIMNRVGLSPEQIYQYPHELSGGQRQRAVIARAIILSPTMVVCDEPVSALDVSVRSQVLNLMNSLQREKNLSYLFISHDLSVIRYLCNRVAVMYLGQIVEIGTKDEIFNNPAHPYTKALLSAIPVPDVNVKTERFILQGDVPNPVNPPSGCKFHTRCPEATGECREKVQGLRGLATEHQVACHKVAR